MRKLLFVFAACLVLLFSCNDDDSSPIAVGDAYIIAQREGNDTVYTLSLHSYSLYAQSGVVVTSPGDPATTYHLHSYEGYKTEFYYETQDMLTELPETGTYHFAVNFENGEVDESEDELTDDVLAPPFITGCSYDAAKWKATLSWKAVEGARTYVVRVLEGNTLVLLSDLFLPSGESAETFSFTGSDSAWLDGYSPKDGTSYTVRISAFKYETNEIDGYNVQAASSADTSLVWGEESAE